MSKIKVVRDNLIEFYCPGCHSFHQVHINGIRNPSGATWSFNNNMMKPTLRPSIHLKTGRYADPKWEEPDNSGIWSTVCHSFVTDGKIRFMNDSTHHLKGLEVELPDI